MKASDELFLLSDVWDLADKIAEYLREHDGIFDAQVAAGIRRRCEVVGGIEIVLACRDSSEVARTMTGVPGLTDLKAAKDCITGMLTTGMKLAVHLTLPERFAAELHRFTGSDEYLSRLERYAEKSGIEIPVVVNSERDIYRALNLLYIEPELREGRGELEAAKRSILSPLVEDKDLQGVFHIHTTASDGSASIAELVAAAKRRGWTYLGIADHSQTAHYAGGLKVKEVLKQRKEIDGINSQNPGFRVFAGIESDILPDGSLDYSDDILAQFDFVVASVHSAFRQGEYKMTERIIKALSNKYVTMLGHPTGRKLLTRPAYEVNVETVIKAAALTNTIIEINCSPQRLDLDWRWHRYAKEQGVMLAINPDAHSIAELAYVRYGIAAARKGGLEPADIINTKSAADVKSLLRRKRSQ